MRIINIIIIATCLAFLSGIIGSIAKAEESPSMCLAKNIYFEAKNQGTAGWAAVASVTLNRVNDTRYPNSICEVVYQGPARPSWKDPELMIPIRHKCQFSWYCDGKSDDPTDMVSWAKSVLLANEVLIGNVPDLTNGSTHYHARYVKPYWSSKLDTTVTYGSHIFYE